jgi:hypothetical protein
MSVDSDLKAGLILEDFNKQLSDAEIRYQFAEGTHAFTISRAGATWQVDFPERVLLEHPIRDLEQIVPKIIQQLLSEGMPRRIQIRDSAAGCLAAA